MLAKAIARIAAMSVAFQLGCSGGSPAASRDDGVIDTSSNRGGGDDSTAGGSGASPGSVIAGGNPATGGGSGMPRPAPPPPVIIDRNAAPFEQDNRLELFDQGTVDMLEAATTCSAPLIYPYDNMVHPGGLPAPVFMWEGQTTAAYAWLRYDNVDTVDVKVAVGASSPGELRIPQEAWDEITRRTRNTLLRVSVFAMVAGQPSRCETFMQIAAGDMKGAIYYNTYNAPGGILPGMGAVMRLTLGEEDSEIYLQYDQGPAAPLFGPCVSCHSVSANGSVIVASTHDYNVKRFDVLAYDLGPDPQPPQRGTVENANFGALTPDGTRMLAMGNPACTAGADSFPRRDVNFPLVEGPDHARMLDVATGEEMPAVGLNADWYMWMPQFSPNGDKVVFNHAKPGAAGTDRRELAIMDYDQATNTFSNLRVIASNLGPAPSLPYMPAPALGGALLVGMDGCTDVAPTALPTGDVAPLPTGSCTGPCYPAYPFFTPDGNGVVFSLTNEPDFMSALPGRPAPAQSELWYVDLRGEPPTPIPLTNINMTMDMGMAQMDYYPTVLPVAVGGYFWVFWTSRRAYGHIEPNLDPLAPDGKRIWAAALAPSGLGGEVSQTLDPTADPSFPGFYVTGQSESGNVRAFATLNPCLADGGTCTAGLDCCTGYCFIEDGASEGTCTEDVPECAKTNERCSVDDDCCPPENPGEPENICIGGFCSFVVVQ